jgi:glycopeptide antibiotics resistance protein
MLWSYQGTLTSVNIVPFEVITIQIEEYLYGIVPLNNIVIYLLSRITAFIPYGFIIALLLRRKNRLPKYASLLILPIVMEVLQYFIFPTRCDIDDVIYAFLGGILGSVLFYLLNVIFRSVTGKEFLMRNSDYRYSGGALHF